MTTVQMTSPAARASLSSPLVVLCVRYSDVTERILDRSNSSNDRATGTGVDWDDVYAFTGSKNGAVVLQP